MDKLEFWELIADAQAMSAGDPDSQVRLLEDQLASLRPAEIVRFYDIFVEFDTLAYTSDLWAAAYIINGGCSDDGFMDFRGWLIAQGEAVYNRAVLDPESLLGVAVASEAAECESMRYVAWSAYERVIGSEMPLPVGRKPDITFDWYEDTVDAKYPKLAAKYFT
jgi:hypothetical protein